MEPNKILSANILDLIFDDRNKAYGAYELRVTYPERVKKSLLVVFIVAAIAFTGAALASSIKPEPKGGLVSKVVVIQEIPPDEKTPPPPPPPPKQPEPETKTEKFVTQIKMVPEDVDPFVTQEELDKSKIGLNKIDGPEDIGLAKPNDIDSGKGIIQTKNSVVPDVPFTSVEVEARYEGNWEKFLFSNLRSNVPVDNGAPLGIYKVIIQFVVDIEGNVSDIKALTAHGYGMEQEAMRVLKKATKWIPANQNGRAVKAYRMQPITFAITEEQ
jgi:periplasmic protein TonB